MPFDIISERLSFVYAFFSPSFSKHDFQKTQMSIPEKKKPFTDEKG